MDKVLGPGIHKEQTTGDMLLQPSILGHLTDRLAYSKITQHIFCTSKNGIERRSPVELQRT